MPKTALACVLCLALCACGVQPSVEESAAPPAVAQPEAASESAEPTSMPEPEPEPAPSPTVRSSYTLLEGTDMENQVVVLQSPVDGPVVYVVGGIHGDETAGFTAANRLKEMDIASGTVYLLSPANLPGAQGDIRYCFDDEDLNRAFPGDAGGSRTQQVAAAIFQDIQDKQPALVLDLHEAIIKRTNRDFLGNSIIYTDLDGIADLVLDILEETDKGNLCSEPFNSFGPGVPGSINSVVTTQLNIPVITTETYREDPLETRVQNHVDLVHYILAYYGMD